MKLYEDKEEYNNKKEELAQILMKKIEENYEGYKDKKLIRSKKYGNTTVCFYKYLED